MFLVDTVPLGEMSLTKDGYLVTDAKAARIGIQNYSGREVGRPDMDKVRVYRPEEEVFKVDSLRSFTSIPLTLDHPPVMVDSANWRQFAVGVTGEDVLRDGAHIRVPLAIKDKAAIDAVKSGHRELSMGYSCDLVFKDGVTPSGEAYDAVQTNIRANHLAIVATGRAGYECRIGDSAKDTPMQKIMLDGISVEVSDTAAQVIAKMITDHARQVAEHAAALAAKDAHIAAKDKELGTLTVQAEELKKQVVDSAKLDALVAGRTAFLADAARLAPDAKFEGKSDAAIKREIVTQRMGDAFAKDRNDDFVDGIFTGLVDAAKKAAGGAHAQASAGDPFAAAMVAGGGLLTADASTSAWQQSVRKMEDAWRQPAHKA